MVYDKQIHFVDRNKRRTLGKCYSLSELKLNSCDAESLSQEHYQQTYMLARKGFIDLITLWLIFTLKDQNRSLKY